MWRRNVLGLRKCSSTASLRHGLKKRGYGSGASLPITQNEFDSALTKVLKPKWGDEFRFPIGLAISGGVDSMALAAMYAHTQSANDSLPIAHGFIVDHKVRPESTEEAEWVAEQLRSKLGMESTVLSLKWPDDFDASDLRRFETDARTLRYQALGRACRDKRITNLMVAHHADDQAETVLVRLANNRLRSGLQGMQSVEWIPECEGIYGVHHSGAYQKHDKSLGIPFPVERGGIQILRPLLGFEKSRLIATCEAQGVEWAEDKTNHIQTYTSRNAIRHIYKNYTLPEALSIQSLVDVSLTMQKRIQSHKAFAQKLFDRCLIKLDIQTGCAFVRFPPFSSLLDHPLDTDARMNEARNIAYCLIERIAELVSPKPKTRVGPLAATISNIYPEFEETKEGQVQASELADAGLSSEGVKRPESLRNSYSAFGVWWRQQDKPSPYIGAPEAVLDPSIPHPREWLLTRQPLFATERALKAHHITYPPSRTASLHPASSSQEPYQLFDGRFWIRLRNHTPDTLILRIFDKTDFRHFPTATQDSDLINANGNRPHRFAAAAFNLLRPSDLRFTLPAVFRIDSATGQETLVGFPTLNVRMDGFGAPQGVCDWSVRYKKVDFGNQGAADIILPGTSKAEIRAEEKRHMMQVVGLARFKARQAIRESWAVEERESNAFTGFKRVSRDAGKGRKVRKDRRVSGGQGEEADGLSFLEVESEKQGGGKRW